MAVKAIGFIDLQQFEPSVSKGAKRFLKGLILDEKLRQEEEREEEFEKIWLERYWNQFNN